MATIAFTTKHGFSPTVYVYPDENDPLRKDDKIIDSAQKIYVEFSYPFEKPFVEIVKTDNSEGFTKAEFVKQIAGIYARVYQEERETSSIKEGNMLPALINRNQTNGRYGIWGHDLQDLVLTSATKRRGIWHLDIES